MATSNPFELLGDDDNDDPSQLIAKQQEKILSKNSVSVAASSPAKLPSKPLPPAQAVREAPKDVASAPRGDRRGGSARGRGTRGGVAGGDRDFGSNENANGLAAGYDGRGDGDLNKPSERGRGVSSGGRLPFRGGRRGGYRGGHDFEKPTRLEFDRLTGVAQGQDTRREEGGRGNWVTNKEEPFIQESEGTANLENNSPEKQQEQEELQSLDSNMESMKNPVEEMERKEPEDKKMTLDEYEKILMEKRRALNVTKTEERRVNVDKEFESMQLLSLKKGNDDFFIKASDKDAGKRKENVDREERVKKSVSINEFLKPAEGERYYAPRGRGRGRGRGDRGESRGGFGGGGGGSVMPAAPSIEDPGQFPTLGGK
ncbi:RGG repeats nuclear RNA binding protein A-like isoform X2 [Aristolochia californica]|uniref:RGG repeats nuclear RNA binding protein A-like isoform X2 n=1 Tax=Aristolochia californica TaxID=171875 RepID=UPI0035DFFD1E